MTVLLAGAFGQRNPGDDALLRAFAGALDRHELLVTARSGARTADLAGCEPVDASDPAAIARALARADALVVAGGTVFKVLHPSCGRPAISLLRRASALTAAARATGRRVAMVGVGAGALPTRVSRSLARSLVARADLLVLRDEESAALLAGIGAPAPFRVAADPAWVLLDAPPPAATERDDVALVALSHLAVGPRAVPRLAASLEPIARLGLRVVLQPWQVGGRVDDLDLARAVRRELGAAAELGVPPADLAEAREQAQRARVVLGLRHHALLAAAAAGTPFVASAHEPKLTGVARRLGQAAVPHDAPAMVIAAALHDALQRSPATPAAIRAQIALAQQSFDLLELVLRDGEEPVPPADAMALSPAPWERERVEAGA
jgi:polysaccharide pyruvyl transferase WcaK-like protein